MMKLKIKFFVRVNIGYGTFSLFVKRYRRFKLETLDSESERLNFVNFNGRLP